MYRTEQDLKQVLDLVKAQLRQPMTKDQLTKAGGITTALGLTNYDLQAPAIAIYPWLASLTPLRNALPRVKGRGDTATRWKSITGINTAGVPIGVSEGNRNAAITITVNPNNLAAYQGIGLEDFVSFEADYAAEDFDDAKARGVESTLRATMLGEEPMLLGGNGTNGVALGTTPTPSATGGATGGALSNGTYYVGCVALTLAGLSNSPGVGAVTGTGAVTQTIARTNRDASTDTIPGGCAAPSVLSAGVVLAGGTAVQSVNASVAAVRGAVAYAWYLGSAAGTVYLQQITTINSVNFTGALLTTTQNIVAMAATDDSLQSGYAFNGLLYTSAFLAGSGAQYAAQATGTPGTGTVLTSDSAGGIIEIDTDLLAFWATMKAGPQEIWCSAGVLLDISKKILAGGAAPLYRFNLDAERPGNVLIGGNAVVGEYLNKFTQELIRFRVHPNLPDGMLVYRRVTNPYPSSGIARTDEVRFRRDYYQIEWPLQSRKYEFGVYSDQTYVNYIPALFGARVNFARG